MRKVKYIGEIEAILPNLGISIKPGQEIEVDEDFNNTLFVPVEEIKTEKGKGIDKHE